MNKLKSTDQHGYTLLEMMIIVVIIGIMATLAAPNFFTWIPKMKLKGEAKKTLNYIRQARSRAVAENCQYGVHFNTDDGKLYFFKDSYQPSAVHYDDAADSIVEGPIELENNFEYDNCSFTGNTVIFFPDGSASTSGSIKVEGDNGVGSFVIKVLAATGKAKLLH